jgi:hypothetical protein
MTRTSHQLTEKQKKYAMNRVMGMSLSKSYYGANYETTNTKRAAIRAARIEKLPHVKKYIEELRKTEWARNVLSLEEKRSLLADLARIKPSGLNEDSPLASISIDAEGNRSIQGPKISDKLKAIELDAKIAGELRESDDKNQVLIQLVNDRLSLDVPDQHLLQE